VLPALVGTILSSGLPVAIPYFLAGPDREDRRLPLTVIGIALAGGAAGAGIWIASAPLVGPQLFPKLSVSLVMLAGVAVLTRLVTVTAKSCSQGSDDLKGANRVIFTEEFMFLPAYGVVLGTGVGDYTTVVLALLLADAATASLAWGRLVRRGFFREATRPSLQLARRVASYGLRAQVGGVMTQLNLRLDFVLLSVITSPAVLGVYAIASKFAELLKIPAMALTYVLYPKYAKDGRAVAATKARRAIPKVAMLYAGVVVPLWLAAGFVIPAIYGAAFRPAITPAQIILVGLVLEGVGGVITAFMYGIGRPGLNSLGLAAGVIATVVQDILLIPRFGATGAAVASAVAYLTSTVALILFFLRIGRPLPGRAWQDERFPSDHPREPKKTLVERVAEWVSQSNPEAEPKPVVLGTGMQTVIPDDAPPNSELAFLHSRRGWSR
jgi:O-antigen/teichoic acid export membrane protein